MSENENPSVEDFGTSYDGLTLHECCGAYGPAESHICFEPLMTVREAFKACVDGMAAETTTPAYDYLKARILREKSMQELERMADEQGDFPRWEAEYRTRGLA